MKWDGLTTAHYKTPGDRGTGGSTWEGITHRQPFKLTFRGWADNGGNALGKTDRRRIGAEITACPMPWRRMAAKFFSAGRKPKLAGLLGRDLDGNQSGKLAPAWARVPFISLPMAAFLQRRTPDFIPPAKSSACVPATAYLIIGSGHPSAALDLPEIWADQPTRAPPSDYRRTGREEMESSI